jgi:hypothetical protein
LMLFYNIDWNIIGNLNDSLTFCNGGHRLDRPRQGRGKNYHILQLFSFRNAHMT